MKDAGGGSDIYYFREPLKPSEGCLTFSLPLPSVYKVIRKERRQKEG
jgi:hypothetical protein